MSVWVPVMVTVGVLLFVSIALPVGVSSRLALVDDRVTLVKFPLLSFALIPVMVSGVSSGVVWSVGRVFSGWVASDRV